MQLASDVHLQLSCSSGIPGQHGVRVVKHLAQLKSFPIPDVLEVVEKRNEPIHFIARFSKVQDVGIGNKSVERNVRSDGLIRE